MSLWDSVFPFRLTGLNTPCAVPINFERSSIYLTNITKFSALNITDLQLLLHKAARLKKYKVCNSQCHETQP